jgi:hypothetical protein
MFPHLINLVMLVKSGQFEAPCYDILQKGEQVLEVVPLRWFAAFHYIGCVIDDTS